MIAALREVAQGLRQADEPTTTATDYLLAVEAAVMAILLWQGASGQNARQIWSVAFAVLSAGALAGGTSHGYRSRLAPRTARWLWQGALLCVAAAGALWAGGSLTAFASPAVQVLGWSGLLIKLIFLSNRLRHEPAYRLVAWDSILNLALIAILQGYGAWKFGAPGSPEILTGLGLSVLGAIVQRRGKAPLARLNHNDLYHVIQMLALLCLFLGARVLTDRKSATGASTSTGDCSAMSPRQAAAPDASPLKVT